MIFYAEMRPTGLQSLDTKLFQTDCVPRIQDTVPFFCPTHLMNQSVCHGISNKLLTKSTKVEINNRYATTPFFGILLYFEFQEWMIL